MLPMSQTWWRAQKLQSQIPLYVMKPVTSKAKAWRGGQISQFSITTPSIKDIIKAQKNKAKILQQLPQLHPCHKKNARKVTSVETTSQQQTGSWPKTYLLSNCLYYSKRFQNFVRQDAAFNRVSASIASILHRFKSF